MGSWRCRSCSGRCNGLMEMQKLFRKMQWAHGDAEAVQEDAMDSWRCRGCSGRCSGLMEMQRLFRKMQWARGDAEAVQEDAMGSWRCRSCSGRCNGLVEMQKLFRKMQWARHLGKIHHNRRSMSNRDKEIHYSQVVPAFVAYVTHKTCQ